MELREYQNRAVTEIRESIVSGNKKPLVVLSTGAGKSIIFGKIISLAVSKGNVCLFLVHRRNLVFQFKETLKNMFGIDAGVVMSGEKFAGGLSVYVATVQTYSRRMCLEELEQNHFFINADILLTDEAHLSLSPTYTKIFNCYDDKIIIGTTATPMRSDQRGLGDVYDDLIDVIGTRELTAKGFLTPVKYFVPSTPDLSKINIKMGDYDKKELAGRVDNAKIVGDVVDNWLKYAGGRKTIVFAVNVKHSRHICNAFLKIGISAAHLDARSTDEERDDVFNKMDSDEISVICNVALYQEGMDVPDISCVVMARPTKSLGLYRQCAGRGMRISDNEDDLIFLDHGGVVEEHGLLTDDVVWSLDGKQKAWALKKRKEKEKSTFKCESCHYVFESSDNCPICGSPVKLFGKDVDTVDSDLVELNGKKAKKGEELQLEKRIFLGMLKAWVPRQRNSNPKRINGSFKGRYGVWPHHTYKDVAPIEPDNNFLSYMKYLAIKWSKSQEAKSA